MQIYRQSEAWMYAGVSEARWVGGVGIDDEVCVATQANVTLRLECGAVDFRWQKERERTNRR
jgi:hypothetical protein